MERVYVGALDAMGIEPTEIQRGARIELRFEVTRGHALPAAQIDGEEFPAAPASPSPSSPGPSASFCYG